MFDILTTLDEWQAAGKAAALATVVATWGSSPRQAGAKLGALADLSMVGSVSGGCVESAVLNEAADALADGKPRLLHFGVADEVAWDVGLACGGKIDIFVEPLDGAWWDAARACLQADHAFITATLLTGAASGQKLLLAADGVRYQSAGLAAATADALRALAAERLAAGESGRTTTDAGDVFLDVYRPRPRLIIIGGAHVAVALAQMATLLGYRVFIDDPRKAFATAARFPAADVITHEYPDKALPKIGLTAETYIAVLTHDPKIDDPALKVALPSPAPYVGVLSGRRTHEQRLERLTADGMTAELLARIRTPIGLKIGAQTPEEIALCIMGEIVAVRRGVVV
jgi:xanthine dehydrogenase accessory factor